MKDDFWQKQTADAPLFPDVLWSKPERRDLAGKLAIIGGNSHAFAAVANAQQTALKTGVGAVKILVPESLKKILPATLRAQMPDMIFTPAGPSGGFAKESMIDWRAAANWASAILFIGDSGANSETAALLENFLMKTDTPIILTRDAVDLVKNAAESTLKRQNIHLIASFSQLQKLFRAVYYPKVLTFNQGIKQVAETLHKFTITYPATISLWHNDHLFVAKNGQVISQEFTTPLRVWSGEIAVRSVAWQIWQPDALRAAATSWAEM